jgi:TonB family protein
MVGIVVLAYAATAILTTTAVLVLYSRWPKNAGGAGAQARCTPYSPSFGTKVPPPWLKQAPRRIRSVAPVYPPAAKEAGAQGVVILEATVGCTGKVTNARVLRSVPLLDEAALETVRQWEYQPVVDDKGVRREIVMTLTVNFTLPP